MLAPATFADADKVGTGPIADVMEPWQTPPPAHGTNYSLYERTGPYGSDGDTDPTTVTVRTWVDETTKLPIRESIYQPGGDEIDPRVVYSYDSKRMTSTDVPADFFRIGAPASVGLREETARTTASQPVGPVTDADTGTTIVPYAVNQLLSLGLGILGRAETEVTTEREGARTATTPVEADLDSADQPSPGTDAPQTTVASYYDVLSGVIDDQTELSIISFAKTSNAARIWRDTYHDQAAAVEADASDPDHAIAGLLSFAVNGSESTASVVKVSNGRLSAFLDIGNTSILIDGLLTKAELLLVIANLEPLS
jgi:hypothetical protein